MRTKTSAAENKEIVLDKIIQCIKEVGIINMRRADIARYAGVTTRCLYKYFGSKDNAIICAATKHLRMQSAFLRDISQSVQTSTMTGYQITNAFLKNEGKHLIERHQDFLMLREIDVFMRRQPLEKQNETHAALNSALDDELYHLFSQICQRGIEDGSIRKDLCVDHFVGMLVLTFLGGMSRSAVVMHFAEPKEFDEKFHIKCQEYAEYCDMILDYIRPRT